MILNSNPFYIRRVVIVQSSLRQYRLRFYKLLRERLNASGIDLVFIYGNPVTAEVLKRDVVDLCWGIKINNLNFKFGTRILIWQPCINIIRNADLVIVEQASKLLLNYILFFQYLIGKKKLAFWGHGKNLQSQRSSKLGESIKYFMSRRVHWWFAYNDFSAEIVHGLGYPADRITSVQNSIDIKQLIKFSDRLTIDHINRVRQQLGLKYNNIGIFIGGIYVDKRLDFLLTACEIIRSQVKDFEMIFVGAGPEFARIEAAAKKHNWIYIVGPKFNAEKIPYFAVSKLLLLPGLVGLAILDSFALGVPLITTDVPYHSPEISYLINGFNGVKLEANTDPKKYADIASAFLKNEQARKLLVKGCNYSSQFYSIENMVEKFANGIETALDH